MWHSRADIEKLLEDIEGIDRLSAAYSLAYCYENAVFDANYKPSVQWTAAVVLTDDGQTCLDQCASQCEVFPSPDLRLALFAVFFNQELLIDWQRSDLDTIAQLLNDDVLTHSLCYPFRFGRSLYDRFFETVTGGQTDHLPAPDTAALLHDTPQGVYQVGQFLIGPLGLLQSMDNRYLPPSMHVPLWHCSDSGCGALHNVTLESPKLPVVQAYTTLKRSFRDKFGKASEWHGALAGLHRGKSRLPGRNLYNLPVLIADCIIGMERTRLLERVIASQSGPAVRKAIAECPRAKQAASGTPGEIAARFSADEQLQLLMVVTDREIASYLDDCILNGVFDIPVSESRAPKSRPTQFSFLDTKSELSSLGVRSVQPAPLAFLCSVLWKAYADSDMSDDLAWRLRAGSGSVQAALFDYVRTNGAPQAYRELVLPSRPVFDYVCKSVDAWPGISRETAERQVAYLLWKTGFNEPRHHEFALRFRARLDQFREVLLGTLSIESEDDRERIRSSGVNLFVSAEEFLDGLISFNTWLLATDHFLKSKFVFSIADARRSVSDSLGTSLPGDGGDIHWNVAGDNALGTLLRYMDEMVRWIRSLEAADRTVVQRPKDDYPHYADHPFRPFPFRHSQLWADANIGEFRRYVDGLEAIVKLVGRSELAYVRNGIDHRREEGRFPSLDKMLACVDRLKEAFELADVHRYLPKSYWLLRKATDRAGATEYEFRDHRDRPLSVFGPPAVSGLRAVGFKNPYVVAPHNLLGLPNAMLVFGVREDSEYSRYWQDYPKRRFITSKINLTDEPDEGREEPEGGPGTSL
jgi:hypothetical protein